MLDLVRYVDKVYCINLDSRKDRWAEATSRFEEIGIADDVIRVSAVVSDDPREGCRLSHVQCVEDAIENNFENILIFEDDVLFLKENAPNFKEILSFLQDNEKWELFYLGGSPMYPAWNRKGNIFRSRFYHTHAYFINSRAFDNILYCGMPIDVWYSLNTVSFGMDPIYAVQGVSYSDIRKEELTHLQNSFQNRYDKLVQSNFFMRWWNYFQLHYWCR
jgi:hypothetical protein